MRPAPAVTGCVVDGRGAPDDVRGRPAEGADDEGAGLPVVGPALGTVRVV